MLVPIIQSKCCLYIGQPPGDLEVLPSAFAGCVLGRDRLDEIDVALVWSVVESATSCDRSLVECIIGDTYARRKIAQAPLKESNRLSTTQQDILNALIDGDNAERHIAIRTANPAEPATLPLATIALTDPEWDVRLAAVRKFKDIYSVTKGLRRAAIAAIILQTMGDAHALVRLQAADFLLARETGFPEIAKRFDLSISLDGVSLANRLRAHVHFSELEFPYSDIADLMPGFLNHRHVEARVAAMNLALRLNPELLDDDVLEDIWRVGGEAVLPDILAATRLLERHPQFLRDLDRFD